MPMKAWMALISVYLIWGTTLGAMRIGVETMPALLLPCLRFLLAGLLLVGWCRWRGEAWPSRSELKFHFWIGLLLFVGGNTLVCWGIQYIETTQSAFLVATTPFWMVWLASVLPPRERIDPVAMVGIGIGFVGMLILLWPQMSHVEQTAPIFWLSVLVMSVNVLSWALGSVLARKRAVSSSLLMSVGVQNLWAGLVLLPLAGWTVSAMGQPLQIAPEAWLALAHLVLFGTIIATPCYMYVLYTLPVTVASTFAYVTPVLTALFGWKFLGERLEVTTMLGSLVILSGVALVQWVNYQRARAQRVHGLSAPARLRAQTSVPLEKVTGAAATAPSSLALDVNDVEPRRSVPL